MINTIGCLSYTPLGYGTPQIQYLLRDLARYYHTKVPVGVFAPQYEAYPDQDAQFPDFSIHHFLPISQHKAALRTAVPELIAYLRKYGATKVGVYGAGTHTKALLELWRKEEGPLISTLITSETPRERMVQGVSVVSIVEVRRHQLDFVLLSSQSFEHEMAERLRACRPELPFAAIYNSHLSRYPDGRTPSSEKLLPLHYEDARTRDAARWLDAFRPDLLVCTHPLYFGAMLFAKHRPKHLIYYAFELPGGSDCQPFLPRYWDEHHVLGPQIRLVLFPEAERMRYYQRLFRWEKVPSAMIYNARPTGLSHVRPVECRNGKLIMQGALGAERNFVDFLIRRGSPTPHIDVYGILQDGDRGRAILLDTEAADKHGYSYCGFVSNDAVSERRRDYGWVFVSWNPTSFDALHACPNKFFEAIADGVPPVAAPHPQCREIIEKYDCGILLRDWSLGAFEEGMRQAREIFGTERYRQLVENCRRAHEAELCWERQFESIRPLLPKPEQPLARSGRPRFVLLDPTLCTEMGHHYHYAQHVLSGARVCGYDTVAAVNRSLEVWMSEAEIVHAVYWYDFWGRKTDGTGTRQAGPAASEHFVRQTRWVIETESLGATDEIFVPNISDADLAELSKWISSQGGGAGPRWHLFVRHDLPDGDHTRIRAMQVLHEAFGPDRVRFYTDTAALAAQHKNSAGVPVVVLPIPIAAAPKPPRQHVRSGPLRVVYLGDARVEKGYHLLPDLVRRCEEGVRLGGMVFTIQAAGSSADPRCEGATAELQELEHTGAVHLLHEKLGTEQYESLLHGADVILALYEPLAYRRRSSHVVVEGLCDGKAVLITRGCASAELLPKECPWLCDDVAQAAERLRELSVAVNAEALWPAAAQLQTSLARFHNGRRLAEMLTGPRTAGAEPDSPSDAYGATGAQTHPATTRPSRE